MQEDTKSQVLAAFQLVMRPIVKILFRYGIGFNELSESIKTAFVDVATSEFGIRGRPTNISRVAVMTGLTRKEVRRLRDKIDAGNQSVKVKLTPIMEILHRWHAEEEFLASSGQPAPLPFSGDKKSFSSLVKQFGGDVPPGAMRTELKRVGCIEEDADGVLRVIRRTVVPVDSTENLVTSLVHGAYTLLSTIHENSADKTERTGLAQFTAYSLDVRKRDLKRVRRISYDKLSGLAESFDDLFMAYEVPSDAGSEEQKCTVAVGLYYFEERDEKAKYQW